MYKQLPYKQLCRISIVYFEPENKLELCALQTDVGVASLPVAELFIRRSLGVDRCAISDHGGVGCACS